LRINAATLAAWSGAVALMWAAAGFGATGAGTANAPPQTQNPGATATTLPSIEILRQQTGLAGTCTGTGFVLDTFINVGTQASADVKVSAQGLGILEEFTDDTGSHLGEFDGKFPAFKIPGFGGGLAPNTFITVVITTYTGPDLSGVVSFTSSLSFNCTTGKNLLTFPDPNVTIPTLSWPALLASMALVALLGAAALRSRGLPPKKR
jgi:hypothetical protein